MLRVAGVMALAVLACLLALVLIVAPPPSEGDPMASLLLDAGLRDVQRQLIAAAPEDRLAVLSRCQMAVALPMRLEKISLQPAVNRPLTMGLELSLPIEGSDLQLVVGPIRPPGPDLGTVVSSILASGVVVIGCALLVVVPLARRLDFLDQAVAALRGGARGQRVTVRGADLVGRLEQGFNRMAQALDQRLRDREELLQAVSHELGTPLARIALDVEMLSAAVPEHGQRRIEAIREDIAELDALTAELVDFVQLERPEATIPPGTFDLMEQVAQVSGRDSGARIVGGPPLTLVGDERLFRRALGNLLRNATSHAVARVELTWAPHGARCEIWVDDDGRGVPLEARERVFDPFVRLDTARSRTGGGTGLGLAITRRIVERHGGKVRVIDAPIGGARMHMTWPMATRADAVA